MGNITHSPFLYNLLVCCGENYKTFVNDINNQIENKIEESYKSINDFFKDKKIEKSSRGIIPKEFRAFVEKMEGCKDGKSPQYCMFGFYKQIAKIDQYLMSSANQRNTITQLDIEIIQRFRSVYDYFNGNGIDAINEKRLRDLFKRIRDGQRINNIQGDLFDFLLTESFPNYGDERGGLLERIRSKSWEEVAFGDWKKQKVISNILQKDDRYKQINDLFNNFSHITSGDIDGIRENLVKVSNFLDKIYQLENYFGYKANNNKARNDLTKYDSVEEGRISYLHSHILAFMRWMPMMYQDEPDENVMKSVDNVIDNIKTQVCEIIAHNDSLKQSLATYPGSCYNTIFTQADGVDLRKLLIDAMCHESHIRLQFQRFYGIGDSKSEAKGGIQ